MSVTEVSVCMVGVLGVGCWQVACADLLVPGAGELVGCSVREDNYQVLKDRLDK